MVRSRSIQNHRAKDLPPPPGSVSSVSLPGHFRRLHDKRQKCSTPNHHSTWAFFLTDYWFGPSLMLVSFSWAWNEIQNNPSAVIFSIMLEGGRTVVRCLTGRSLCLSWNTDFKKKWFFFFLLQNNFRNADLDYWFFSFTLCASSHGTCEHELSVQITLTDPACCYFLVAGDSHFSRVKHGASGNSSSDVTACNGEFLQPSPGNVCILLYTWVSILQMLLPAWVSASSL